MDNLTHSLTGIALARAGMDRLTPRAVWLLLLSANAPDGDIVAASQGAFRYLQVHRGYSHSLLAMPLVAALCTVLVAAIFRQRLPWARAWFVCLVGVGSHILLDLTNSYGIRLFLPFSSRWSHLDVNSLYDGYVLAALAFAFVWPLFAQLVSGELGERGPSRGRGSALFALSFFIAFDVARLLLHNRVVAQLESRLYEGAAPVETAALPEPFNPFRWTAIVETSGSYRVLETNAAAQLDLASARTFYKPAPSAVLVAVKAVEPFRFFVYFARFPVWSTEHVLAGRNELTRVELTDLRFGTPGGGSFHCVALINTVSRIVESRFAFSSGANLGRPGDPGYPDGAQ